MKLITFAIPCYNSQDYMERAIKSILPGGDDVEILIINDGSSDKTGEIADSYERKYPGIIRAIHQENGGHGEAVNTGLRNARGLYYKVVDSDDWINEEALIKVIDKLKEMVEDSVALDMMVVNYVYEKPSVNKQKEIHYRKALPKDRIFTWNDVGHFKASQNILMHSVIYRTKMLKDCGLELPKHTFYVDNIFVFHPLPVIKKIYYMDVGFYRYYIGREDQSVNEKVMIGRIDQQIFVTKTMLDDYDLSKIKNKKLRKYMAKYIVIMLAVCTSLLMLDASEESLKKNEEMWEYLKNKNARLYKEVNSFLIGKGLQLKTKAGRKTIIWGYQLSRKIYGFN